MCGLQLSYLPAPGNEKKGIHTLDCLQEGQGLKGAGGNGDLTWEPPEKENRSPPLVSLLAFRKNYRK